MAEANNIRGFYWSNKAYYAKSIGLTGDQIMFGMYGEDGDSGTIGEMSMEWIVLDRRYVPQLHVFDDAWKVLASFSDLIYKLGEVDDQNISPEQFVNILKTCNFKDFTQYTIPTK